MQTPSRNVAPRPSLVVDTWLALIATRRAVPLLLVAGALTSAEWLASESWLAVALDGVLLLSFVLVAPALSRALSAASSISFARLVGAWTIQVAVAAALIELLAVRLAPALGVRATYVADPRSLGILVVLFVVGGWGLGRDIDLERGLVAERARAERLAGEAEHAQILAVRAQLDPHFLFNTLNAIAEWCRTDPAAAEAATLKLASMLRGIFDAVREPTWPLGRELALLEELAALYTARDSGRYVFSFSTDASAGAHLVPPLLVLPLFENAIKHGPAAGHAGSVALRVSSDNVGVRVEIENPGSFSGKREGGHGIAAVERRLELTYGASATLTIDDDGGRTTTVLVLAPAPPSASQRLRPSSAARAEATR